MISKGIREAIVLAGGFGRRLSSVITDVPKPMAEVRGRPFLDFLLERLYLQGFEHVVISIGFKGEVIEDHYGKEFRSMKLDYAVEKEPLGTGGGIANALTYTDNPTVFVFNGDTIFDLDVALMEYVYRSKEADAVIALREVEDAGRYGRIRLGEEGLIEGFIEKAYNNARGLINGGVYLLRHDLFEITGLSGSFSIEKDCFEPFVGSLRFAGYASPAYFIDIGVPDDYERAQKEFIRFEK